MGPAICLDLVFWRPDWGSFQLGWAWFGPVSCGHDLDFLLSNILESTKHIWPDLGCNRIQMGWQWSELKPITNLTIILIVILDQFWSSNLRSCLFYLVGHLLRRLTTPFNWSNFFKYDKTWSKLWSSHLLLRHWIDWVRVLDCIICSVWNEKNNWIFKKGLHLAEDTFDILKMEFSRWILEKERVKTSKYH